MKVTELNFQKLIEEHKGILLKVARTYCHNEDDRVDLIQEMSIQIWRSLDKYNDKCKISTWMYRVALNVAISFYRKNAKRNENTIPLNDELSQIPESENKEKEGQLILLERFIQELHNLDKALMLLYLEDRSYSEIAEILGITPGNVGTKINRIKSKLKTSFSQLNL
ncbi:MAG TPA: sigma-70 family RNA polymerase sigma factor [Daejeonella sp.]|jgi:RNA polymerase sigma-70 factor (ECF subfamily)|uniref:RNA polymerase sigma factor n=1 Tax=Daejeonella sp. TaxID=2805397 RepID=UPI002EDB51C7